MQSVHTNDLFDCFDDGLRSAVLSFESFLNLKGGRQVLWANTSTGESLLEGHNFGAGLKVNSASFQDLGKLLSCHRLTRPDEKYSKL